ncbi:OLC1v1030236C1 [Oldenlandia corymbosa var. corymbosa]|uniref:OLC1v1030236C1 n=1 Tax=Oldenlandia corymbosa var. corymbosa TaxID=529605 RepID=A0AAV1CJ12_OLDCO|nr:OLC1v1030236C1 [Oldenlandia corymbosa var. corymbosa]
MAFRATYELLRNMCFWLYACEDKIENKDLVLTLAQHLGWPIGPNVEKEIIHLLEELKDNRHHYNQERAAFLIPHDHQYLQLQSVVEVVFARNLFGNPNPINGKLFFTPGWHLLQLGRALINQA